MTRSLAIVFSFLAGAAAAVHVRGWLDSQNCERIGSLTICQEKK